MDENLTLKYDQLTDSHFWLTSKSYIISEFLKNEIQNIENIGNILEIGCCGGKFLSTLYSPDNSLFGLDLRLGVLQNCKKNYPFIDPLEANAALLPFQDATFDFIIMQDVLEHLQFDTLVLQQLNALLKTNGFLFICVPAPHVIVW